MYKLLKNGVLKDGVLSIPKDPQNRHWIDFKNWERLGGVPIPMDPDPVETKEEKRRKDPDFPSFQEFLEAALEQEDGKPGPMAALVARYKSVKLKHP